jgi:CheY-like chemotaxis protein
MNKQRILVLDDHATILDVVTEALQYEQYEVLAITKGLEFFNAVRDFAPDLILLDYQLADVNGADLCQQLKELETYRYIPVIIFSAYFNPGDSDKPAACDGYLYKPFDLASLFEVVHLHLAERSNNELAKTLS